jgi:hypothetical protein
MTDTIDEKKVIYADLDPSEGVVLNLDTKNYYRLNSTGQVIWQGIAAGRSEDEIVERLMEEFDVGAETARSDVRELLEALRTERLVTTSAAKLPSFSVEAAQASKRAKK